MLSHYWIQIDFFTKITSTHICVIEFSCTGNASPDLYPDELCPTLCTAVHTFILTITSVRQLLFKQPLFPWHTYLHYSWVIISVTHDVCSVSVRSRLINIAPLFRNKDVCWWCHSRTLNTRPQSLPLFSPPFFSSRNITNFWTLTPALGGKTDEFSVVKLIV